MDINKFNISSVGDSLEIWVEVPIGPAYSDVRIKSIAIQDHLHYTSGYPERPQVELTQNHPIDTFNIPNPKKVIRRIKFKDLSTLGIKNTGFFFMYVKSEGIPGDQIHCICFRDVTVGVAVNLYPLYNKAVKLLNIDEHCNDNESLLIDIFLKEQIFLKAIEAQDYNTAIRIWNNLLFRDVKQGDCLNANTCNFNNFNNDVVIPFTAGCKTCT